MSDYFNLRRKNFFRYVISTLELLVMDEYTIIYFHGAVPRQKCQASVGYDKVTKWSTGSRRYFFVSQLFYNLFSVSTQAIDIYVLEKICWGTPCCHLCNPQLLPIFKPSKSNLLMIETEKLSMKLTAAFFRFKKNLKSVLIVHPTFFLRTVMLMSKPFIR